MGIGDTNGIKMPGISPERKPISSIHDLFRKSMTVTEKWAYFDHAAVGPLPIESANAIRTWCDQANRDGDVPWMEWSAAAQRLRSNGSRLLHCDSDEIALIPNTTFGINVIAAGYPWNSTKAARDSVVILENEFPSNFLPWTALERRNVEVRKVPVALDGAVDLDAVANAIDSSTRLVSASWVGYASGFRLDVAKLCELVHARGAELFLDAIQGLGVFTLNLSEIPIDYVAADGHKWMLGPEGAGLLFIRRKHLEKLEPMMIGWGSIQSAASFQSANAILKPNASRYEGGSANHAGLIGFSKSLELLLDLGCNISNNPISDTVLENAAQIEEGLLRLGLTVHRSRRRTDDVESLSGIVSFEIPGHDPIHVRKQLLQRGVVSSVRHHRVRIATHAYNNSDDIVRMCDALREIHRSTTI